MLLYFICCLCPTIIDKVIFINLLTLFRGKTTAKNFFTTRIYEMKDMSKEKHKIIERKYEAVFAGPSILFNSFRSLDFF